MKKLFCSMYKLIILVAFFCLTSNTLSAKDYVIFGGNSSLPLATSVASALQTNLGRADIGKFSDGEISLKIKESVRNKDIYYSIYHEI